MLSAGAHAASTLSSVHLHTRIGPLRNAPRALKAWPALRLGIGDVDRCTHSYAHSHVVVAHGERLLAYVRKRARNSSRSAVACGPLAAFALPLLYGLQCGMTSTNQARLHAAAVELTCQSWTQKRDGWARALQSSQEAASASISSSSGPWRPPQTRQTPRALERRRVRRRSANSEAHRLRRTSCSLREFYEYIHRGALRNCNVKKTQRELSRS